VELECAKFIEKMDSEEAECRHPGDYCKYRTACIIHFMSLEKSHNKKAKKDDSRPGDNRDGRESE